MAALEDIDQVVRIFGQDGHLFPVRGDVESTQDIVAILISCGEYNTGINNLLGFLYLKLRPLNVIGEIALKESEIPVGWL